MHPSARKSEKKDCSERALEIDGGKRLKEDSLSIMDIRDLIVLPPLAVKNA